MAVDALHLLGDVQLAPLPAAVVVDAAQARGRAVGPRLFPLLVREVIEALDLTAFAAGGARPAGVSVVGPVDLLAAQLLQQEAGAGLRAALVERDREGPQDQDVLSGADPGGGHGAVALVDPPVDLQVHQRSPQGFALTGVGRHAVGRRQRQLSAMHFEELLLPLAAVPVEVPVGGLGLDGVDARLIDAVKLPGRVVELHVDHGGPRLLLAPAPGVHRAHLARQERLVGDVVREGDAHADSQRQGSQEVARVLVVVLEPPQGKRTGGGADAFARSKLVCAEPPDLARLVAALRLQCLAAGHVLGNGPAQGRAGVAGVLLGAVLVDLVLAVVAGHHRRGLLEFDLLQPRVVGASNDSAARGPLFCREGAALYRLAVQVAPVVLRQLARPDLIRDLVPPVVFAAFSLGELDDPLEVFPHQQPALLGMRVLDLLRRLLSRLLELVLGDVGQVAAADRRKLLEVAAGQDVDPAEGPGFSLGIELPLVGIGLDLPQALVHLGQDVRGHEADLVDEEPAPVRHALHCLCADALVPAWAVLAQPKGRVDGAAAQVGSVAVLVGQDLPVHALPEPDQVEELLHVVQHMGFAGARRAVQQIAHGLPADACSRRRRASRQVVLGLDPVHHELEELQLLRVHHALRALEPVVQELRGDHPALLRTRRVLI